jgi:glycosyltransferase involved in cell wall biosynthesis
MKLSVIVPAFNEEACLAETLASISAAITVAGCESEIIVVDNISTDHTREVAIAAGAKVVNESERIISRVRNTGAAQSDGDIFVFIDADTLVPETLFARIAEVMKDEKCLGGGVAVEYFPIVRTWIKYYVALWLFMARFVGTTQGAAQFYKRSAFEELKGYDETIDGGEDMEIYTRLKRLAQSTGSRVELITEPKVISSARKFDKLGIVRTLFFTHPVTMLLAWRKRWVWKYWYERAIR